jgi:hypothetical protein
MPVPTKFIEILKEDQNIVESRLNQMGQNGLLELFDGMLELINDFTLELEAHTASLILPKKSVGTTQKVNWNDRLGLHMMGVVVSQYIFAFSHVCRAQPSEAYVHMRRAIEAAGIAYSATSDPDLAKVYGSGDEKRLWPRIKRDKILPRSDPLTYELNSMMKQAASKLHGNLKSVASNIEEGFEFRDSHVEISFVFRINELNPDAESVWEDCSYILTAMYHICQLFAARYGLPKDSWHARLEGYRADIAEIDSLVKNHAVQVPPS